VPLLLDDLVTISANPSIRNLHHLSAVLNPPAQVYSVGRPLLNFTFALNYALGGERPFGYHALNLVIHVLSTLALFGLICELLQTPRVKPVFAGEELMVAFFAALLWAVHPLQTEAVTYISQRAESLMGLCYIATLFCFVRGARLNRWAWFASAVLLCTAGMATKEVMVTAPLLVLGIDRLFLSGTFRECFTARRWLYISFLSTWLLLAYLMISTRIWDRDIGTATHVTIGRYLATEIPVVADYLKLALWPSKLAFYYGPELYALADRTWVIVGGGATILALIAAAWLMGRKMPAGYLLLSFFVLLAPTSSFVPVAEQPMAESRMYLPLAALVGVGVVITCAGAGRRIYRYLGLCAAACLALTLCRNRDYRSEIAIWGDAAAKQPASPRLHNNFGRALAAVPGHQEEAAAEFRAALRLNPNYPFAQFNLALSLSAMPGQEEAAIHEFQAAIRLEPTSAEAHLGYADMLARLPRRASQAGSAYKHAITLSPRSATAHNNYGAFLARQPEHEAEARHEYEMALSIQPDYADAHFNLGVLLAHLPSGRSEAIRHFKAALEARPDFAAARHNLQVLLRRADAPGSG